VGARQRAWADRWRVRITLSLGGRCIDCMTTRDLTFDVREPVPEEHHGLEKSVRMSFYRKQWRMGNLCLRCRKCNALKGRQAGYMPKGAASVNFSQINPIDQPVAVRHDDTTSNGPNT
jgi:hypothetical protein